MSYTGMGEAAGPSHWTSVNGVCKPGDALTLERFKAMQAQMNRVASAFSLTKIGVDGDIGPKTLTLLSKISAKMSLTNPTELALANTASSDCNAVARDAGTIQYLAKAVADARGIGAAVASPAPSRPPSISTPAGPIALPPTAHTGIAAQLSAMPTTHKLALGVGVLALGVAAGLIPLGKKRRRSS